MPSLNLKPTIVNLGSSANLTIDIRDNVYYSPAYPNKEGQSKSLLEVWDYNDFGRTEEKLDYTIIITNNGTELVNNVWSNITNSTTIQEIINNKYNINLTKGKATIFYKVNYSYPLTFGPNQVFRVYYFTLTYDLYITENTEPLPKWNAWTVCERMLNIAETIRQGETPRFKLDEDQEAWLSSIETPEFQFTQSTLRECLQGVGAFIHAKTIKQCNKKF